MQNTTYLGIATLLVGMLAACSASDDDASSEEGLGGSGPASGGSSGASPSDTSGGSGNAGAGGSSDSPADLASCTGNALPPVSDFGALGPFETTTELNTGPDGQYTIFRPVTLGADGFKHPPATWGNGITTIPEHYGTIPDVRVGLLDTVASHGFVVIASNSTTVNASLMTAGLDWLLSQNESPGAFEGALASDCAVTIGYSLGGGAAIDAGSHPSVITTVAFHNLVGAAENLDGPLLLITSTNDGFVTKAGYAQPTYDRSAVVPTILATLEVPGAVPDNIGHLIPLGDAGEERAPAIAWLRLFVYGDEDARSWFHGSDCALCKTPWVDIQRKNGDWE